MFALWMAFELRRAKVLG